ncbi:MG2 domain-containing protein [Rhizobium sp.]|uniref:alpha-2-macroglobulin family protein n=1 Tax=Rhizobium sp. TaxID=391 RepID=UPI002F1DC8AD
MSKRTFIGFSALLLTTFTTLMPAGAADTKRQVVTTQDGDYYGFDLRTEQNVTLDQCSTSCIGDKSCKAFTYNPKVKWCFLKSDFNQLNTVAGAIAGKIVETAAASEPDIGAAPTLPFLSDDFVQSARDAKSRLTLAADLKGQGVESLIALGRIEITSGNVNNALNAFQGALSLTPDNGDLWVEMARAANTTTNDTSLATQAAYAALNGYQLSRTTSSRADALAVLATSLQNAQNYRQALSAYKASLTLTSSAAVQAAYNDLKARQGFRVTGNTLDNDNASPRACVQFSEKLVKSGVDYTPFVTVNGAAPKGVDAKDNQICVEGLEFGQRYRISLRPGLPSSVDEDLAAQVNVDVYVKDRAASIRFTGDNFVLPSTARRGIPIVSVNTTTANLKLYRIGDRNIAQLLNNSQFLTQMSGYGAQTIQDTNGELVWQGSIEIQQNLNKDVVTSFPVDEALPQRKPGVYVLTAVASNGGGQEWDSQATQWFVVSDIGITTYAGTDGLNVFTRSLGSAKPTAGVELQLLAKNNEILGTAKTDANGRATFSAGLMRGTAGMTPAVIAAQNGDQDYVFLDMTRAGFDLSDRGVAGRTAPGAIDLTTWTERGIYRAGETVHASALARDISSVAVENLPLTFVFLRPDGVEDRRIVTDGGKLGGYNVELPLQQTSMRGSWTMNIYTDPKGSSIGSQTFLVDDFVPDRTEFDMKSDAKAIEVGKPTPVNIEGRYLYGAPAAGLSLEGEVTLKPTRQSDDYKGYQFGLADEGAGQNASDDSDSSSSDNKAESTQLPLEDLQALDEDGKTTFDVTINDTPSTTQLLNADINVRMQEAGGRAVERSLTLPVRADGPRIGIKPEFDGDLGENSIGAFHVIAIDQNGQKQAVQGLTWKLLSVERDYQWYRDGNSWKYEPITSTKQVATGTVNATTDGAEISVPVTWGRYRLEVETADTNGPESSVEFNAGWYVASTSTETPDALEVALDKSSYHIGDTAKLKVTSRYAGQLMVTAGSETLISVANADIGATGGEVDIPVTADWGAGTYLTATLFRPGEAQESRMPMRAIGIKWAAVDPGERKLQVKLDAPPKTLPRQPLSIAVQVTGAGANEDAYVTLAAVDVGILNLTRYEPPAPDAWYYGQRQLGLEIRDIYGRLIDGSLGATGKLRTGGDGGQAGLAASPPTQKLVAFFSGPVKLDADGKANVSFDIPQFNGTARLMAVAWSKAGVGHATQDVIIRDPVVVTASLPRFLAPGDKANLRLDIANTDAPAGDYKLAVTGNAAVTVDASATQQTINLQPGGKYDITLPLTGGQPGAGTVSINLSGASGLSLDQSLDLPVRPAQLPVTERRLVSLAPGKSLTVNADLLADSVLPGASVSVNVSRSGAFDVPALLMSLSHYPYGCAEQTASSAMPLLYFSDLAIKNGLADDTEIRKRVQDSIYREMSYQSSTGSFGLWGPGSGDLWLDAYVTDFLTRAREQKYTVPDQAMAQALENLQNALSANTNVKDNGNEIAYALYVLARNKKASISDLRYYADTMLNDFPTPLSKAHLAAALALYGDAQRSRNIFVDSLQMSQQAAVTKVSFARSDYGSSLRDGAAVLALAAESRPVPPIVPELATVVAKEWQIKPYTSTQEQTWMLLAARALQNGDDGLTLDVNGAAHTGTYMATMTGDALIGHPLTVTNTTRQPLAAAVTTVAAPVSPLPAGGNGFKIERKYYTLDGEEANITQAQQNERYVVVLHVTETNDWPSRILVTDLLPAGFEIDNPSIVGSAQLSNFDWLSDVQPAHVEFRNDRFVAAFDQSSGSDRDLSFAYVVRAVTPGTYDHPAASVEDMYRPQFSARTAMGRMEVLAAQQ